MNMTKTRNRKTTKTTRAKDARTENPRTKAAHAGTPRAEAPRVKAAQTTEERLHVINELNRRIAAAVERLRNAPLPEGLDPFLPPGETVKSEWRTIRRLRDGTIRPTDPTIDPLELAGRKEARLRYLEASNALHDELLACHTLLQDSLDRDEETMLAASIETLRQAKELPEAKEPGSDVAWSIRRMNRARRGIAGGRVR
jgi:hypothetical protein